MDQISPKTSPAVSKQDSTGTLKTKICLQPGRVPSIIRSFYMMGDLPESSNINGASDLIAHYGLEHSYKKLSGKKVKEKLSSFLPDLPGDVNMPGNHDNSSLRSIIEKPPITGKEFRPLTGSQLIGFKLHPGKLPDSYKTLVSGLSSVSSERKKRPKERGGDSTGDEDTEKRVKKEKKVKEESLKKKKKKKDKKKKDRSL